MTDDRALPQFADVTAASRRLRAQVRRTPVVTHAALDARAGRRLFFKCENLQVGGAFKYRGALNAVLQVAGAGAARAVATHSSGNHGIALTLAARACGLAAHVVVPRDAAANKIEALRELGGRVTVCEPGMAAREAALAALLDRESVHVVHPFDDARVIAGQGTAALELLEEIPDLDVVCVPVGGGGLLGGTALAARGLAPACAVIGAEPEQADDAFRSLRSGIRQSAGAPATMADGLRASIGVLNFELLRRLVDDVVTVSEPAIAEAMGAASEALGLPVEPSAAVAVAAALSGRLGAAGARVGVVLSGGNVPPQAMRIQRISVR